MVYRVMMNRLVMTMMDRVMGRPVVHRMVILRHGKTGHRKKNDRSQ
jgi:hypothetical protein